MLLIVLTLFSTSFFLPSVETNLGDGPPLVGWQAAFWSLFAVSLGMPVALSNLFFVSGCALLGFRLYWLAWWAAIAGTALALSPLLFLDPSAPAIKGGLTDYSAVRVRALLPGYWVWTSSLGFLALGALGGAPEGRDRVWSGSGW